MVLDDTVIEAAPPPDATLPALAERHYLRGKTRPLGGSARAFLYAGPRAITIRGREIIAHPNATCLPDGGIGLDESTAPLVHETVFPLAAGRGVALGDFCASALPGILAAQPFWPGSRLVGAALTPAQHSVLARLGIAHAYRVLTEPASFATVLAARAAQAYAAPADVDYLALMDLLRNPPAANVPAPVALLPAASGQKRFALRNRASLAAWLRARHFTLLEPDTEDFAQTASTLAQATLVLLAEPEQAGLLGLCPPETQVLEIAPEGWAGAKTRALCDALGLRWNLFLADPPAYPVLRALPLGASCALSYEVKLAALGRALEVV